MRLFFTLLFLPNIIGAFSTPSLYNRIRYAVPAPAVSTVESIDPSALSASLHRAFPSSSHHPAYASALHLLDSLATTSSCQRIATTAFVSECNELNQASSAAAADVKLLYAVKLAVCEFEVTGVMFPIECANSSGKNQLQICLRKLEERPQWWTTLSNNLQNAVMLCAAVRHEVEEDNLLNLYRNVTKAQKILAEALSVTVQHAWDDIDEQQRLSTELKVSMNVMRGEVMDAGRVAAMSLEKHANRVEDVLDRLHQSIDNNLKKELAELGEVVKVTQGIWESTDHFTTDIERLSGEVQATLNHMVTRTQEELLATILLVEQASKHVVAQLQQNYNETSKDMEIAANAAFAVGRTLQDLNQIAIGIALSHTQIADTQDVLFARLNQQDAAQEKLQQGMNQAISVFEGMIQRLLSSAEVLEKTLDNTEARVQMLGVRSHLWLSFGACCIGLALILGADIGKLIVGAAAVTGGSVMLLRAPEVTKILQISKNVFHHQHPAEAGESGSEQLVIPSDRSTELSHEEYPFTIGFILGLLSVLGVGFFIWFGTLVFRYLRYGIDGKPLRLPVQEEEGSM